MNQTIDFVTLHQIVVCVYLPTDFALVMNLGSFLYYIQFRFVSLSMQWLVVMAVKSVSRTSFAHLFSIAIYTGRDMRGLRIEATFYEKICLNG